MCARRCGLLTGAYPQRFGCQWNEDEWRHPYRIPSAHRTLPEALRAAGYVTGHIGKWNITRPVTNAVDEVQDLIGFAADYFPDAKGHYQGVDEPVRRNDSKVQGIIGPVRPGDEYLTDRIGRHAVEFIDRHKSGPRPFFLYLAFNAVHSPFQAKKEWMAKHGELWPEPLNYYAAMTASLDENIGRLLARLDELGLASNTVVALTSDNGPSPELKVGWPNGWPKQMIIGSAGPLSGHKGNFLEGGNRVPFILRWPGGLSAGRDYRQPVSAMDLYPTLCAAAGVRVPSETKLDGVNLLPFLRGDAPGAPHPILFWKKDEQGAVRSGEWKLLVDGAKQQLFNLADDPAEKRDLASREPEVVRRLRQAWSEWSASLPPRANPPNVSPARPLTPSATSQPPGAPGFTTSGAWSFSSLPGHETNKTVIYSPDSNATATWTPRLRSQGPVRVSLYVIAHSNNVAHAKVEMVGGGTPHSVTVNMRPDASRWVHLGTIELAGQGKEFVRVRPDGPGNLRLCALRMEILDAHDGSVWQTLVLDDLLPYDPAKLRREASREIRPGPPNPERWELTFSDDFNGDRLDTNVWMSAQGQTWGQLQSIRYPENIAVTNGLLRLVTRKEKRGGKEWTSAMISTRHFAQRYGYWESRYRYAAATGLNQAFWMNPGSKAKRKSFENDVALDASFEIDVNEGHYPADVNATLHQGGLPSNSKRYGTEYDLSADFHIYAAEWNEREVIYFFDGQEIHRVPNAKAHMEVPVIYATAVLPWAGPITDALDGKSMDVDWVRVYQRKADQ